MSNLSDLLPAGAGAKSATFTADGTLATGTTVALQSDGTVTAVAEIAETLGSQTQFESGETVYLASSYDANAGKIVIAYRDNGNSFYGTAVVGTVSGTTISFGTPVVFYSTALSEGTSITYDSTAQKHVMSFVISGATGRVIVGTVSGTSISFGTSVQFDTVLGERTGIAYDSNANASALAYVSGTSFYSKVVTVSGTTPSLGSRTLIKSAYCSHAQAVYDSNAQKVVVVFQDPLNSSYGTAIVGTISGTSISFGSSVVFESAVTSFMACGYDSTAQKVVIAYRDQGNSNYGTAIVGTVSGTSISFGSATVFESSVTTLLQGVAHNPVANVTNIFYANLNDYGSYVVGTVSGTSISFGSATVWNAANTFGLCAVYDSAQDKTAIAYRYNAATGQGRSFQNAGTNSADFVGITDEAIADTATGSVVVEGGVITNSSLNIASTVSVGSTNDFDTSVAHNGITYDTNSDKIVNTYRDDNNSYYGTAIVGTQSGTSFTYGTPVVFESVNSSYTSPVFDSGNNKVVVFYRTATAGRSVVGTVSGTSISFGTPATFDATGAYLISAAYDSNAGKVVVAYSALATSQHGKAAVGTVSGTSISFGTAVTFRAAQTAEIATVYDSTNNKIVIGYNDDTSGDNPTAIVGTVSGTSISFGSPVVIQSTDISDIGGTFDSTNGKVIFVYKDETNSNYGTAAVGTVSGTSISFGTPVVYSESNSRYNEAAYDSSAGAVVVVYQDTGDSSKGKVVAGVVSGTSISFNSATTFDSDSVSYLFAVYNPDEEDVVVGYQGNAVLNNGRNVVLTTVTTVITGSTYYVQDDGSLSTTSSSVTAGKALSSTTLLLKG